MASQLWDLLDLLCLGLLAQGGRLHPAALARAEAGRGPLPPGKNAVGLGIWGFACSINKMRGVSLH